MPQLPPRLVYAFLAENNISVIHPVLPESLKTLNLNYNFLRTIPPIIPKGLTELLFIGNMVSTLPLRGESLTRLNAASNRIKELPEAFALNYSKLIHLNLLSNPVQHIQSLPPNLETLRIENTQIQNIFAASPDSLIYVCSNIGWMEEIIRINQWMPTIGVSRTVCFPGWAVRRIERFREWCFAMKMWRGLHCWLWRTRERRIRQELAPELLIEFLERKNPDDKDELLEPALDEFFGTK
jgi:hypothetical protein